MGTKLLQFFLITKFKTINSLSSFLILDEQNDGAFAVLENLMSTVKSAVQESIANNASSGGNISCGDFQGLIADAFRFFKILAPVLLILFGTLDFVGAVVSGDGDMKKSGERFAKRLAAAALVFLIPTLLSIVLGFAVDRGIISSYLKCWL